jgi:DNA adenine methylase
MKYMGSKRRIAKDIIPILETDADKYEGYVELFCGSCSVIKEITRFKCKTACDANPFLIGLLKTLSMSYTDSLSELLIAEDCIELITKDHPLWTGKVEYFISKDTYDTCRQQYRKYKKLPDETIDIRDLCKIGAVGFLGSRNGKFYDGGYN